MIYETLKGFRLLAKEIKLHAIFKKNFLNLTALNERAKSSFLLNVKRQTKNGLAMMQSLKSNLRFKSADKLYCTSLGIMLKAL